MTRFAPGDAVFGFALLGAQAEYLVTPATAAMALKPARISFAEAAAIPFGALNAPVSLRDRGRVGPGGRVLVHGASGGVGVYAVQLARHFGATVTGVCSAGNHDLVRSLGAARAIDYRREPVPPPDERYDVILDLTGRLDFRRIRALLTPRGRFLPLEFGLGEIALSMVIRLTGGRRIVTIIARDRASDLELVADLVDRGVLRPVLDDCLPFDRISDAQRRTESRHKRGSIVVTMVDGDAPCEDVAAE